jgi:hypothetical protein
MADSGGALDCVDWPFREWQAKQSLEVGINRLAIAALPCSFHSGINR